MKKILTNIFILFLFLSVAPSLWANNPTTQAIFDSVKGKVLVKFNKKWVKAEKDMEVSQGKRIMTDQDSTAVLRFFDGSAVTISQNTEFTLAALQQPSPQDKIIKFKLFWGHLAAAVKKLTTAQSSFEIEAGGVVCGVRGTEFWVANNGGPNPQVIVKVVKGSVYTIDAKGNRFTLPAGTEMKFVNGLKSEEISPSNIMGQNPAGAATPVWSGVMQAQFNLGNNGNSQAFSLAHVQVHMVIPVDAEDTLFIMPDYALSNFTLLDAFGMHQFSDISGLSIKAGQFKFAFGDNRYLPPQELKRTSYNITDALIPGNAKATAWDLGVEVREQVDAFSIQVDAIQGEGPNTAADPGDTIDLTATAQYKTSDFILGVSDYSGKGRQTAATSYTTIQNWFDAFGRLTIESVDFRAEAILAPDNASGIDTQLSIKPVDWFEPLVWFETMNGLGTTTSTHPFNTINNNLGAGVNLWAGAKTRLSLDLSFVGTSDILSANSETLQVEEVF